MKLKNKKLTEDEFFSTRKEVLSQWSTGKEVDLQEAADYLKSLPKEKNFCYVLSKAKKEGITLAQPRAGVALVDAHIELLRYLQNEGGADLLPSTIDSYTRQNRYDECEIGIEESKKQGRSMLNGFPAVNHGVKGCRKVLESVNVPLQARHGTPDSRLLAEIIHAGGWTSNEGGGISYNIPYAKNVSVEKSLTDWQYCDRLVGLYEEMGVHINREPFGPLTGTLVPASISNSVSIIEALLAAEQGVKNITIGYGQCGNMMQDIAAMKALKEQAEEYFKKFGYDIELTTVFHEWMGGFPEDEAKAFGLISYGAVSAALSGATKVIVKTPHEAVGIPTKEANAAGIKATKEVLHLLQGQRYPETQKLRNEIKLIKAETKCILDKTFELGDGDLAVGTVKAFENGTIDIPFAPSKFNAGKVLPARDNNGAIRFLDFGNIPFTKDIKDYHRSLLEERGKFEGREVNFQMCIDDIYAVSRGALIGRPGK
ncbi:MAG TPA: methylaspartate mutase subunit E [Clostridiaceae bacterium]|jgi:methylaspartate mutase epsilon subunit|nr:methylaspartate mutase subunit E [Clostridiaceae bacterium]HBF78205.1 methylaspartate mutase subunit E [Clostridiaceae bacterium]HBG37762.1 methylaspartate mutase subunit E [Clostridiaceae bacterium]HBN27986.1 methylaspartate mutase subunit E [Clostridiaceae bacterium]HBX48204.1 methylaspartate mutase subunit E [Clostridiaceae bacterium]